jgi:ribonuclease VapC
MVIDTSALIAILTGEPEADAFSKAIAADRGGSWRPSTARGFAVIESRKGPAGGRELDLLLHAAGMDVVAMDSQQSELARAAYRKFARVDTRRGSTLGDCCAYAGSEQRRAAAVQGRRLRED